MTLRARLALVVAGAVAIAVVAAVAVAWLATQSRLRGEVDRELAERAAALADVPAVGDLAQRATRPGAGAGLRPARPFPGIRMALVQDLSVQIVGADGAVTALAGAEVPVTAVDRAVAAAGTGEVGHDARVDGDHFRVAVAGVDGGGAVLVARDVSATDRTLRGLALLLTVVALGGVAAAAVVGLLVARRALRPIDELSAAAERVARDQDLTAPLPPPRAPDEVGRLTASFNTMLAALATSRAQQHRLVADAGHELRTPLTSLRTTIELLRRADRRGGATLPAAQRDELYEHAIEELGELTHLTDELVELATDARSTPEERDTVALREVVEAVATRAGRRTGRPVEVTADDTTVHG
ncbi:MAG: HAMP domain-containing protein, partial [Acidimicrobiales bacterium]|nr:HAMP domain-containing protein [Acidimicrobiales bacterium]